MKNDESGDQAKLVVMPKLEVEAVAARRRRRRLTEVVSEADTVTVPSGTPISYSSATNALCERMSGGDPFDIMGSAGFSTDLNCFTKIKLGWLDQSEYVTILPDDVERTIELNPFG